MGTPNLRAHVEARRTGLLLWDPFPDAESLTVGTWGVERIGPVVYFRTEISPTSAAPVDATMLIPAGYRPRGVEELLLTRTGGIRGAITITQFGQIYLRGLQVGTGWRCSAQWLTDNPWPAPPV